MADEKKPETKLSEVKSINEWVDAYYSFDGWDYSKKDKVRHVTRVSQFAGICYYISKNSKKAHADLFESNYTASSTFVANIAELVIKLLEMQTLDGGMHKLTADDFAACGGKALFGSKANYSEIVEDFIGDGGIVEGCHGLFPIKADNDKNAAMFKEMKEDISTIKSDHANLLASTGKKAVSLELDEILALTHRVSENSQKKWIELNSKKSKTQFDLMDAKEALFESKRDLAFKSGKVAMLGGGAVMAVGAVAGGVFWPALMLIPMYTLSKKWIPDLFKSLGNTWGHMENRRKLNRTINRTTAELEYLKYWKTYGEEPKWYNLSPKHNIYLRGIDKTCLKKQGKLMFGVSTEDLNKKFVEGLPKEAEKALTSGLGLMNDISEKDNLVPADLDANIKKAIKAIDPNKVTYDEMMELATDIKSNLQNLPSSGSQDQILSQYADKLRESLKHLVFETKLENISDYGDFVKTYLPEDSPIFTILTENNIAKDIPLRAKRYISFAGSEQSQLNKNYVGLTLDDYINRTRTDLEVNNEPLTDTSVEIDNVRTSTSSITARNILNDIVQLRVLDTDGKTFMSGTKKVSDIVSEISAINDAGSDIANARVKKQCNDLLKEQMKRTAYQEGRRQSKATYEALTTNSEGITGPITLDAALDEIGKMDYENMGTYSGDFVVKVNSVNPKEARLFILSKAAVKAYKVCLGYIGKHAAELKSDLDTVRQYLQKVNASQLLNSYQKMELSDAVSGYIRPSVERNVKGIAQTFVKDFNGKKYSDLRTSEYQSGGFQEYLTGIGAESLEVKKLDEALLYYSSLATIQGNLHFGDDKYTMDANDELAIGRILLLDINKDFAEVKYRKPDDELKKFLESEISHSKTFDGFSGKTPDEILALVKNTARLKETPYTHLVKNIDKFKTGGALEGMDNVDKYAALQALKYRALADMKTCLNEILKVSGAGRNINDWLMTGVGYQNYQNIVNLWLGKMVEIDNLIEAAKNNASSNTRIRDLLNAFNNKKAVDLMKNYNIPNPTMSIIEETQLGG